MDVLLPAQVLEHLWPYSDTALSMVRFPEQNHVGAGLPNAAPNTERDLLVYDSLEAGVWAPSETLFSWHNPGAFCFS